MAAVFCRRGGVLPMPERNPCRPAPPRPHLRRLHMPLMPGSSTSACSTTPMPLRTTRSEPSAPAPEHVTICGGRQAGGGGACEGWGAWGVREGG